MKVHTNTLNLTKNTSRIGSAIVLVIGACLVIPSIADAAGSLNDIVPKYSIPYSQNTDNSQSTSQDSSNVYEPPDFGSPVSAYGSSTR